MKTSFIGGFFVGCILGFLYSQGVQSQLSKSISTTVSGGKLDVQVDLQQALVGGISAYLG